MDRQIEQLMTFQRSFKGLVNLSPTLLTEEQWKLRLKLSQEELDEYRDACEAGDLVEIFDAILDRIFLAIGDAVSHGLQDYLIEGFDEVVRSNLSKLDENGQPIINGENGVYDESRPFGKILKSKDFSEPMLDLILKNKDYTRNKRR